MQGSRKFCQRAANFFSFFLVDEQRDTISEPSLACEQNAIKMAFCWRADYGRTLNAGLVTL